MNSSREKKKERRRKKEILQNVSAHKKKMLGREPPVKSLKSSVGQKGGGAGRGEALAGHAAGAGEDYRPFAALRESFAVGPPPSAEKTKNCPNVQYCQTNKTNPFCRMAFAIPTSTAVAGLKDLFLELKSNPENPRELTRSTITIAALFFSGARCQEICNLDQRDVLADSDSVQFRIRTIKNGSARTVSAHSTFLVEALHRYREEWKLTSGAPLVVSVGGRRSYPRLIHRIVKHRFPQFSPHSFRHHYAQLMANSGVQISVIQYLLGHRFLNTTAIYLGQLLHTEAGRAWKTFEPVFQSDFLHSRTLPLNQVKNFTTQKGDK